MKKALRFFFAGVFGVLAFTAFTACSDDDENEIVNGGDEETYDEAYYASQATVTSSDANFTANSDGGTISFNTEGGSVTLAVSCGCNWTIENDAVDLFPASVSGTTVTVTAEQNIVEEELTGTVTFKTLNDGIVFATIGITQSAYGAPTIRVETNEVNFSAVGELTAEISVEATADWTAEVGVSWLSATNNGGTSVTLIASENETAEERSAKVTFTCSDGVSSATDYITVTQDAHAYITLSVTELSFEETASSADVTVESNYEWTATCDDTWVTVTSSGNKVNVAVIANDDTEDRWAYVALVAGDGENVAEAELEVGQLGAMSDALIMTFSVPGAGEYLYLPLSAVSGQCFADWGDGTTETVGSFPRHSYSAAGGYKVKITGTVTALNYGDSSCSSSAGYLVSVNSWGNTGLTTMTAAFKNCTNLVSVTGRVGNAFKNVTNFATMFSGCTSLETVPDGLFQGTTNNTTFANLFEGCTALKEIPAGLFPTTFYRGTNGSFQRVFSGCTALKEIPAGLFDKTYSGGNIDFSYAFCNCTSLEAVPEGLFDVAGVESTNFMCVFQNCTSLVTIPVSLFDKCLKFSGMAQGFQNCSKVEGESPYTEIEVSGQTVKVHLYERGNYTSYGFTNIGGHSGCFTGSSFSDYANIPSDWK